MFTLLGALWLARYAKRVRLAPETSMMHARDDHWRAAHSKAELGGFGAAQAAILFILFAGIGWVAWGVTTQGYYLGEIAAQFMRLRYCGDS